ncbi:MAG TPA: MipA/OmpV family protein [Steroidobacteraceae bacterium]|nr:MipA/OmpV family protein [Steroidobacteraceae bacterium]
MNKFRAPSYRRAWRGHVGFGVSAAQSAASGLPPFEPGSGVDTIRFSLGAHYHLTSASEPINSI